MHILVFAILMLNFSCRAQQIQGTYKGKSEGGNGILVLDSNYRFNYKIDGHMSHINTMGAWKYVDGDVYLQSDSGITSRNGEVVEEITSTLNGMQIQFFTVDCKHLYGTVDICVNDSIFIKTDSGELNVPFRLKSFYARFSSNSYYYYKVKDSRANHLRVCLLPVSREFFLSNEKFKLKDRGLIGRNDTKLIKQLD